MRSLIASIKLLIFGLLVIIVSPLQLLVLTFTKGKHAYDVPCLWHKAICSVMRIRITIVGPPAREYQTLYVGNHLSYLDIPAIGSIIKGSFVAKKDVESWPLFGFLSRLQQTAFISRSREDAGKEKNALDVMLRDGKSLILFPEGTSTDGQTVLPFKSSLFSIALLEQAQHLYVQPFTVTVNAVNGKKPETQDERDIYAWHINMDTPLHIHLWRFAKSRGASITLHFHPPILASGYNDRKVLAKLCHDHVSKGLYQNSSEIVTTGETHALYRR
ncbi:MAG: 1-acyl-sn-glycerol-3-phosphate acyltransferase [Rhodospirillales bacterium]|nr:1-acyl-sn-glycerol-3-phosphate acyltransferase [Alphaproteobacteria bacterium]MCB1839933.1 1-acyl-sn-glycerol-3-phosphate acyltransferase [Alphaproteobacteria bacterium]MCB9976556.1 1-acyl-sn-glycerol-3-phosphate acyltransferase [Rhodospirillales bacterium]